MESLIRLLGSLNIEQPKIVEYVSRLRPMRLKKQEHFQMQGDYAKYMGYVDAGKFRYYKIDRDGNEHTLWFNHSFPFIGDYHSFLKKTNAELCIQAMNDYDIIVFSYEQIMELFGMNTETLKLRTSFAERSMYGWRDIALSLHFDSAEERYRKLLDAYPDIEKEIPLKYIASTLSISPETLSRIRKKSEKNSQT